MIDHLELRTLLKLFYLNFKNLIYFGINDLHNMHITKKNLKP